MSKFILRSSRKERKSKKLKSKNSEWLIVCGREKTEVNYIKGLFQYINRYCPTDYKMNPEIFGVSCSPKNLVEELKRKIDSEIERKDFFYSKIFVVFDIDDFLISQIKKVISFCEANDYICCYSNECFEVWLYLHFKHLVTHIPRKDLFQKLTKIFQNQGIGLYKKTDTKIFEKMNKYGSVYQAYENAKKVVTEVENQGTTMYRLLDEIDNRQHELELPGIFEMFHKKV